MCPPYGYYISSIQADLIKTATTLGSEKQLLSVCEYERSKLAMKIVTGKVAKRSDQTPWKFT